MMRKDELLNEKQLVELYMYHDCICVKIRYACVCLYAQKIFERIYNKTLKMTARTKYIWSIMAK